MTYTCRPLTLPSDMCRVIHVGWWCYPVRSVVCLDAYVRMHTHARMRTHTEICEHTLTTCVVWLDVCAMAHVWVCHDSYSRPLTLPGTTCKGQDSCMCAPWRIYVLWLPHVCAMTRSCRPLMLSSTFTDWHHSFTCVPCCIRACVIRSCMCHDEFMCAVTHLCRPLQPLCTSVTYLRDTKHLYTSLVYRVAKTHKMP